MKIVLQSIHNLVVFFWGGCFVLHGIEPELSRNKQLSKPLDRHKIPHTYVHSVWLLLATVVGFKLNSTPDPLSNNWWEENVVVVDWTKEKKNTGDETVMKSFELNVVIEVFFNE